MSKERKDRRKFGWRERLGRLLRYRLQIPIKRSAHSPEHIARGVMIGTVWAASPLFGAQMLMVFLTWLSSRRLFNWDFSLINGLAWTWTTNVFTVIPFYYFCYATGQIMLGRIDDVGGYHGFQSVFALMTEQDQSMFDSMVMLFGSLFDKFGLPLLIGCVMWAVVLGWVAYRLTLGFVHRYRLHRARVRRDRKQARGTGAQAQTPA